MIKLKNSLNLFWREPISQKTERIKEKENNVTHAFLVTLNQDKKMAQKLITKLLRIKLAKTFEIDFQVSETRRSELLKKKNRIILFVNSEYNLSEVTGENSDKKQKDIPDGLILDKNAAILIETKVNASKSKAQINRYNNKFFSNCSKINCLTWQKLYSTIAEINSDDFVTQQFLRYLEAVGLSGFRGIPFFRKNFEWNLKEAEDITKELCIELKKWFIDSHKDLVLGERPKAGAWDYFYLKKLEYNAKKLGAQGIPHMSFGFNSEAFDVMVTFNKKTVLKKILGSKSVWKDFFEHISRFSKDSNTYLMVSHYKMLAHKKEYKGHRQGPKYSDFKIELQLSRLNKNPEEYFKNLLNLIAKEQMKEIAIIKKFYYQDSFDKEIMKFVDGENALKKIKSTINELEPYYKFIVEMNENDTN